MSFFAFQDIIASTTGIMLLVTLLLILELLGRTAARAVDGPSASPVVQADSSLEELRQQRVDLEREVALLEQSATLEAPRATPAGLQALEALLAGYRQTLHEQEQSKRALQGRLGTTDREAYLKAAAVDQLRVAVADAEAELGRARNRVTVLGGRASAKRPLLVEVAAERIVVGTVTAEGSSSALARFAGADVVESFIKWAQGRSNADEYFVLIVHPEAAESFAPLAATLEQTGFELGWDVWASDTTLFAEER